MTVTTLAKGMTAQEKASTKPSRNGTAPMSCSSARPACATWSVKTQKVRYLRGTGDAKVTSRVSSAASMLKRHQGRSLA